MGLVVPQMATLSVVTGPQEHVALPMAIVATQRRTVALDAKVGPALALRLILSPPPPPPHHLQLQLPKVPPA